MPATRLERSTREGVMSKIGRIGNPTFTYSEVYVMMRDYGSVEGLISTCLGVIFCLDKPEDAWPKYCAELLYEEPETLVIDSVVPEAVVLRVKAHTTWDPR
jgi:hypothetical protein